MYIRIYFMYIYLWYYFKLLLGDTGSIEYGAECEERPRRDSQPMDNGNN